MPPFTTRARRTLRRPPSRRHVDSTRGHSEAPVLVVAVIVFAAVAWARRKHRHKALPGPGDDKPAGYENPVT